MTTGWSLDQSGVIGDLSQTDSNISDLSPIPIKNSESRGGDTKFAMFAQQVAIAEVDEDVDFDRISHSNFGSMSGVSIDSETSVVLAARKGLAEAYVAEAEAEKEIARRRIEAARITLELATHKASSQSSSRSRTRIHIQPLPDVSTPRRKVLALPVVLAPQPEKTADPMTAEMYQDDSSMTGDGRGLSGDLSSLIGKDVQMNVEFVVEEPMHEPEHRDATIDDQCKSQERQRLNEVEQVAEARHQAILEQERERTRLNQVLRNEASSQEVHELLRRVHEHEQLTAQRMSNEARVFAEEARADRLNSEETYQFTATIASEAIAHERNLKSEFEENVAARFTTLISEEKERNLLVQQQLEQNRARDEQRTYVAEQAAIYERRLRLEFEETAEVRHQTLINEERAKLAMQQQQQTPTTPETDAIEFRNQLAALQRQNQELQDALMRERQRNSFRILHSTP